MNRLIEIRCTAPQRRDALEESARLALAFLSVSARPGGRKLWQDQQLRMVLSVEALDQGCYLPEAAQELLEAVQAYGVAIARLPSESPPPDEWSDWWYDLEEAGSGGDSALELNIT